MGMVLKNLNGLHNSTMVGQCKVLFFSHVIYVDTNFSFWKFQFFYSTTPMSLKLFMFIVDWLWNLSILLISIHSTILSYYQSCLFCSFLYIVSIFYPFYSFCQSCPLYPFLSMSMSIFIYFVILCPFLLVLSSFVNSYLFCQFSPIYSNLWSITIYLWPITIYLWSIIVHP